jgi:hypothetical protein
MADAGSPARGGAGIIYLAFCYPMSRLPAAFEDRWNVQYGI